MGDINAALKPYPTCPVCCGASRHLSNEPPGETGFYTRTILESLDLAVDEALEAMRLWRCETCATLWYDPWFDIDRIESGYGYLVGRHKYGWASLRNWASKRPTTYFPGRPKVLAAIQRIVGDLSCYAEVNCPFSGLMFELAEGSAVSQDRSIIADKISTLGKIYGSASLTRDYGEAEKMRALNRRAAAAPPVATRRMIVEAHSPFVWRSSCILGGASCHAVAKDLFVDAFVTFDDLDGREPRPEAIGFFNVLDHFPDPMAVLNMALSKADLVVVNLHKWAWTDAQHHFNIGTAFANSLGSRGVSHADIGAWVTEDGRHGDETRYLLFSRVIDLAHWKSEFSWQN
jgi:hypothetical protein